MPRQTRLVSREDDSGPLRETGDVEMDIPFHSLDPVPWNPKPKINGVYRRGLKAGLDHLGLRDRLKVWPNPNQIGRYYVLDGNQRIDVIAEMLEEAVFNQVLNANVAAAIGDLDPESKQAKEIRKAEALKLEGDEAFKAEARSSATSRMIPCRVLAELDPDDAKLFVASYDRNRSKFDEAQLTDLRDSIEEGRKRGREMLDRIIRPERPFVAPPPSAPARIVAKADEAKPRVESPTPNPDAVATNDDEPWGKPPEDAAPTPAEIVRAEHAIPRPVAETLIPVMFSFTPEGHAAVTNGILRTRARVIRQQKVVEALNNIGSDTLDDVEMDSAVVEIALRVYQARLDVAGSSGGRLYESKIGRDDV